MIAMEVQRKKTKARRGRGEGGIVQRKDKRWQGSVSLGYMINDEGRRVRRRVTVYGLSKQEVIDKLDEVRGKNREGTLSEPSKQTVGQHLDQWLEERRKIRASTEAAYRSLIKAHIKPAIGNELLANVTKDLVERFYKKMEADGLSDYLRRHVHAVLRRALKDAKRILPHNPCNEVEAPHITRSEIQPLTADQVGLLLEAAKGNRLECLFALAIETGMREGELLGLRQRDIDWDNRTIRVCKSLQEVGGTLTLGEPKTKSSRRAIKISQNAIDALNAHRRRMMAEGNGGSELVFCAPNGSPIRRSTLRRGCFKPLLKKAGLPDIRFHDLRHTSATLALTAGVHSKIVQTRLGHTNIAMTLGTYSHLVDGMDDEAADAIAAVMTRKPKTAATA
jgi:integrase